MPSFLRAQLGPRFGGVRRAVGAAWCARAALRAANPPYEKRLPAPVGASLLAIFGSGGTPLSRIAPRLIRATLLRVFRCFFQAFCALRIGLLDLLLELFHLLLGLLGLVCLQLGGGGGFRGAATGPQQAQAGSGEKKRGGAHGRFLGQGRFSVLEDTGQVAGAEAVT